MPLPRQGQPHKMLKVSERVRWEMSPLEVRETMSLRDNGGCWSRGSGIANALLLV